MPWVMKNYILSLQCAVVTSWNMYENYSFQNKPTLILPKQATAEMSNHTGELNGNKSSTKWAPKLRKNKKLEERMGSDYIANLEDILFAPPSETSGDKSADKTNFTCKGCQDQ